MAAAAAADPPSSSSGSIDSYVSSSISLTFKSKIRYEGVLFYINTEESSFGLRKVRSFGTEGRKKDGLQLPPSEKVYEYILFRGSNIKDLQVQSSPPIQTMPIHHDPAIIQSHYPQAPTASMSLPSSGPSTVPDPSAHTAQMSLLAPAFQGSLPLYQPSVNLRSWGSSPPPPTTNVSGLVVPMYWQGYYGCLGFQAQQQSLLRPPPGLSMPPSLQQTMQYPAMTASLPSGSSHLPASPLLESPSPLLPPFSLGTRNLQSSILPAQSSGIISNSSTTLITNNASARSLSTVTLSNSLPLVSPLSTCLDKTAISSSVSDKSKVHGPVMPFTSMSESTTSIAGTSSSILKEEQRHLWWCKYPHQKNHYQHQQQKHKNLYCPLPLPSSYKVLLAIFDNLLSKTLIAVIKVEFDFIAMNEKFHKDELWGVLGRSNRAQEDVENSQDEDSGGVLKHEIKPVYVQDDFFDSLSCGDLDRESRNGRTRFSEQVGKDSETFSYISRHWGGRGEGRGPIQRGRSHVGYYGRGYGYVGRGRGHSY
ncbi:hypothetical protein I3842_03G054200 [Carya illinoinensis]|uniref:Protein decapping 5-like n=1 Tax=Carya illinoinensis TaxID=32201 RepID=A0A922FHL6_CARIL|nr:hypothetical protein I3842_03G054200 [Carya illinoinensis]